MSRIGSACSYVFSMVAVILAPGPQTREKDVFTSNCIDALLSSEFMLAFNREPCPTTIQEEAKR